MLPGKLPPDFRMLMTFGGDNNEPLQVSFSAQWEYELDRVIAALKIMQGLMRDEVQPLPRSRSLVTVEP